MLGVPIFTSFYDFSIGIWNCSDSVVFFFWGGGVSHFITQERARETFSVAYLMTDE